ncbi:MAG: Spy/CpxP family protein refolding chaperone [Ectothiorhodospira sp.]
MRSKPHSPLRALTTTCALTVLLAAPALVHAQSQGMGQEQMGQGRGPGQSGMGPSGGRGQGNMAQGMAQVEEDLDLTGEQRPLWDEFMKHLGPRMAPDQRDARRQAMGDTGFLTRMRNRAAMAEARAEEARKAGEAAERLYESLDRQQRRTLDEAPTPWEGMNGGDVGPSGQGRGPGGGDVDRMGPPQDRGPGQGPRWQGDEAQ